MLTPADIPPQGRCWNRFYAADNRYQDRNYLRAEFPCLAEAFADSSRTIVLEVGAGNGANLVPIIRGSDGHCAVPAGDIYACDLSHVAVRLLGEIVPKENAFHWDITKKEVALPRVRADFIILVFTLSAVHPDSLAEAAANVAALLRPGGSILFRDYAVGDAGAIKFQANRIADESFIRGDGTLVTYFTLEFLRKLFPQEKGFRVEEVKFVEKEMVNRKLELVLKRRFMQCRIVYQ